jgi:hypothetical protein
VAGRDLDITQVHPGIEHGGDKGVAQHVWARPGDRHPGVFCESAEPPGGGVPVHPPAEGIGQDRPARPGADSTVDGPADRWWQRDQDHFAAFAADPQDPVSVLFAEVADVGAGGFEDPQPEQAKHGHQGEVTRVGRLARGGHLTSAKLVRSSAAGVDGFDDLVEFPG